MVSCCQAQAIESVETEDLQRKWLQCFRKCWVSITSTNRILGPKRGVLDVLQSSWSWDLEAARGYLAQYYVKWKVATSIWSKDFVCVVEICRIMINVGFTQCHLHHPPKKTHPFMGAMFTIPSHGSCRSWLSHIITSALQFKHLVTGPLALPRRKNSKSHLDNPRQNHEERLYWLTYENWCLLDTNPYKTKPFQWNVCWLNPLTSPINLPGSTTETIESTWLDQHLKINQP